MTLELKYLNVLSLNTFIQVSCTQFVALFDFDPSTFCHDPIGFSDGQPPDTRQDLTGLFTVKPQSGEVTVGEWLHNTVHTINQDYDLSQENSTISGECENMFNCE